MTAAWRIAAGGGSSSMRATRWPDPPWTDRRLPMNMLRFALRNLWRDLKSGELAVLLLALCVAVLSLTAVGFFTSRISQGVRAQASEVLAADLRLESPHPIPARYFAESRKLGLKSAQILTLPTAIFNGDASQLAALNAVTAE